MKVLCQSWKVRTVVIVQSEENIMSMRQLKGPKLENMLVKMEPLGHVDTFHIYGKEMFLNQLQDVWRMSIFRSLIGLGNYDTV